MTNDEGESMSTDSVHSYRLPRYTSSRSIIEASRGWVRGS